MYKITIKGIASTNYPNKERLSGITCQDDFAIYAGDDLPVFNGYCTFRFIDKELWTITEYYAEKKLTQKQLAALEQYTVGQWSDGIGESYEQHPCYYDNFGWSNEDDEEQYAVYVSMWHCNQKVFVEQTRVG